MKILQIMGCFVAVLLCADARAPWRWCSRGKPCDMVASHGSKPERSRSPERGGASDGRAQSGSRRPRMQTGLVVEQNPLHKVRLDLRAASRARIALDAENRASRQEAVSQLRGIEGEHGAIGAALSRDLGEVTRVRAAALAKNSTYIELTQQQREYEGKVATHFAAARAFTAAGNRERAQQELAFKRLAENHLTGIARQKRTIAAAYRRGGADDSSTALESSSE